MQDEISLKNNNITKVLVIDDSSKSRLAISKILADLDCEVVESNSGIDALNKIIKHDFALILLDVQMPVMDGFEIATLIKSDDKYKDIPILFVTSFSREEQNIIESHKFGVIDYIIKPIDPVILSSKVAVYLNHYKQIKDLKNELETLNEVQTSLLETNFKLQELSKNDPLTGMSNRMCFDELLVDIINSYTKNNNFAALMLMDLDNFKQINDHYGHDVGDKILKMASKRMKDSVMLVSNNVGSSTVNISRLGGDEFAIIISNLQDFNIIFSINNAIKSAFSEPFIVNDIEFSIDSSVGVAVCPYDGTTPGILYKNADQAMYKSKSCGKGRISFFSELKDDKDINFVGIDLDIKSAITNREFYLNYQPIYDLNTKQVVGCEALCRWNHPQYGSIPPYEFITKAESTGLINDLGAWILEEAISKMAILHKHGMKLMCAVNISNTQLYNPNFSLLLDSKLKKYKLPSKFIELEITETTIVSKSSAYDTNIANIKDMCVRISIDDFGTGHSSLKRLGDLPISTLKIDRSFMQEINNNDNMVLTVLELAKNLKLKVVAEGIETQEQLDYLVKHGCKYGQGFLMSKPVGFQSLLGLIESSKSA